MYYIKSAEEAPSLFLTGCIYWQIRYLKNLKSVCYGKNLFFQNLKIIVMFKFM